MIVYCLGKVKTQRKYGEAVDECLPALKFIPDRFATSKMLETFDKAFLANDDISFFNKDFNKITFVSSQRHIPAVDLNKVYLDNDNNFDENDPDTIINVRLFVRHSKFGKRKVLKKDK